MSSICGHSEDEDDVKHLSNRGCTLSTLCQLVLFGFVSWQMRIGEGKGTGGRIWNLFHQIHQYIKLATSVIMLGVTSNRQTGINCPNLAIGGCIDAANKQTIRACAKRTAHLLH
jgi:hypothetical protein